MKSQVIRKRNIPSDAYVTHRIQLKPKLTMDIVHLSGVIFIAAKPYLMLVGAMLVTLAFFCLFVMPDGVLCEFTRDYLILYNRRDRSECMLVYWDDIVSWQYEWHPVTDMLSITLVDGSTETLEVYSSSVRRYMKLYCANKENRTKVRRLL